MSCRNKLLHLHYVDGYLAFLHKSCGMRKGEGRKGRSLAALHRGARDVECKPPWKLVNLLRVRGRSLAHKRSSVGNRRRTEDRDPSTRAERVDRDGRKRVSREVSEQVTEIVPCRFARSTRQFRIQIPPTKTDAAMSH